MSDYTLNPKDRRRINVEGKTFPAETIYVRKEFLPPTGKEWETFYAEIGGEDGKFLWRLRIPEKSITQVTEKEVHSDGELVTKIMGVINDEHLFGVEKWAEKPYTPIVKSWLKEVKELRRNY